MEIAFSAILGEIVHRSMSSLVDKFSKEAAAQPLDETLRLKLLRVRVIVEEAEGRQIRSQAMLEQLKLLRASMYRGHYMLDSCRYQAYREDDGDGDDDHGSVSHYSFALSNFNPAKRIQLCGRTSSQGEKELHQVINSLEMIITNMKEFIMYLNDYPPLYRRIYSTYLVMDKCMFGRHAEMEQIINFLMREGSPGTEVLEVLPIVGPAKVGKSTLVEHVCNDERVRAAFSRIIFLAEDDLNQIDTLVRDGGKEVKHQSHASERERVLLIVEVNGDIDEATWSNLYLTPKMNPANLNSIKVIICSRSDKIARFGTTQALRVEYLTREAYWYFFKALAFGSADPEEEPKLASMAMDIAGCMNCSFIGGNIVASMLRANFSAKFWRRAVPWVKEVRRRYRCLVFGAHPVSPWKITRQAYVPRINNTKEHCWILNDYQIASSRDEAPKITIQEVCYGDVVPYGKYDVLAWRSSIPPYNSYIFSCEINKVSNVDVQRKHSQNIIR